MTRIIIQWLLIFSIGGVLLLASGESTVPSATEYKSPNSVTPLNLFTTGNGTSETISNSISSKNKNTHIESEKLATIVPVFELAGSSKTPDLLEVNSTDSFDSSEGRSTEVLTTVLPTKPSKEGLATMNSKSSTELYGGGYNDMQSVPLDDKSHDEETESGIDNKDAEGKINVSYSPANEILENIFNKNTVTLFVNDAPSTEISDQTESDTTESPKPLSAVVKNASEKGLTNAASLEHEESTESGNTINYSENRSSTSASDNDASEPTFAASESTKFSATETLETVDDPNKIFTDNLSIENSMSLHKTTPKSATKKRSLNGTGDSTLLSETTAASGTVRSTSFQPELSTLLEHGGSLTLKSADGMIMLTNSDTNKVTTMKENAEQKISAVTSTAPIPNISSELQHIGSTEKDSEQPVMHYLKSANSSLNDSEISANKYDEFEDKESTKVNMQTENMNSTFYPMTMVDTSKVSGGNRNLSNLVSVDDIVLGVTFDPDGMKNSEPQDPDSVIFYVPSTISDLAPTPQNTYLSTVSTGIENSEAEREFDFITHKNLREGDKDEDKTGEMERVVFTPQGKNTDTPPEPSRDSIDSTELVTIHASNSSNSSSNFVFWDPSNGGWILPETVTDAQIKRMDLEVNDESEEMLQDAPHFTERDHTNKKPLLTDLKQGPKEKEEIKTTDSAINGDGSSSLSKDTKIETATELGFVGSSNSFVPHHTDQSVIRPVKIQFTSPEDKSVSTSILPESFSTSSPEKPTELNLSEPTAGTMTEKIESSSTNTSSPIILPNPALSVTQIVKDSELSTIVVQPELLPTSLNKKIPEAPETSNSTYVGNSTIAGIAVKTSVSVSLPLSNAKNETNAMMGNFMQHANASSLPENTSTSGILKNSESSAPTSAEPSTDGLTDTSPSDQTTAATVFKIRKPKIKIPGGSDSGPFTPRPSRPFSPSLKRPTTTAGPPVSIFKKQRTRIASITSSTTARPLRTFNGNFATIKIQYASDIPGLLPQEFLLSTEPVTTTTTEPTTTEEPISEVPFTDQTHTPTVVSEDDVTLVKVAGYIVLDRGLRWNDLLHNRHSPEYKKNAEAMHLYLERMFRSSPVASRLWKIEIDGFSGNKKTRPVGIDFFLYLIKNGENIPPHHLARVFHEKLSVNNTFGTFRVDTSKTAFEMIQEQPLKAPTPAPEEDNVEPPIPQWAIAVIVIGAASLIFIVLFATVTIYGRHHMRRRYSSKLSEEDLERSSGEWESKMAAAYENMAADTIYDAEDLHGDSYKKNGRIATFHGIPSTLKRCDSWSSNGWTTPPKKKRPHVH